MKLNFSTSNFTSVDGYGNSAVKIIKALESDGFDIRLVDAKKLKLASDNEAILQSFLDKSSEICDTILCFDSPAGFKRLSPNQKLIGYTMFETTSLPEEFVDNCNQCDLILVPATQLKQIFIDNGVEVPIEVLPLFADDSFQYVQRPNNRLFTFLFLGTIDEFNRKGWYELFEAFTEEFDPSEAQLIFKSPFFNLDKYMVEHIKNFNHVKLIAGVFKQKEIISLFQKADCFVFPTHGEGFGLTPLEAMATGLPTIVTDWLGCSEYIDEEYCYPLSVDSLEPAIYAGFPNGVGNWATVNPDKLKALMRHVYLNRSEANSKGYKAVQFINEHFRAAHFSKRFSESIGISHKISKIIKKEEHGILKLNLTCEGLVFGQSGFAEAVRNMVCSLNDKGCKIKVQPHDDGVNADILSSKKGKIINSLLNTAADNRYKTAHIAMTIPLGILRTDSNYRIGYVMFETQEIPEVFIPSLMENTDELWVPSVFNFKNFTKAGYSKPIFVMPFGVDIDRFNPNAVEPLDIKLQDKFIFLSVMGWSERKGISILVKAYLREFSSKDNVVLYLKGGWYNHQKAKNEVAQIVSQLDKKNSPEIVIDFNLYSNDDLPKLYKRANCFVLASLGEGWGLNYTEAMAMELPTIGTRCTSQVDFMTHRNSFLIKVKEHRTEPKCDWVSPQYVGGKFAIPSIKHLQELMRQVYTNPGLAKKKGRQARRDMINKYQWKHAAEKWFSRLKELEAIL